MKQLEKKIMADIKSRPAVPVWPHAGMALGIGRGAAYQAAHTGEIETVRIGKTFRAITAPLRKKLKIDA